MYFIYFFQIGIIPLVSGSISVHIKLESDDISQEINRKIQIHSVVPEVCNTYFL